MSPALAGCRPIRPTEPFPPLLPIDHVMINKELTATSVTSFAITGTDHRGLFATLQARNHELCSQEVVSNNCRARFGVVSDQFRSEKPPSRCGQSQLARRC